MKIIHLVVAIAAAAALGACTDEKIVYSDRPPFNPPKRTNYGQSILKDPRLPLEYLIYLFGPEVKDLIVRLEAELTKAQNGTPSELLQLLIGRDAEARYQIPVHEDLVQIKSFVG